MKTLISLAALAAVVFAAGSANAVTMTNMDSRPHKLTIVEGDATKTVEIAPNERLENLCASRCEVSLEGDPDPYELESADIVQIEDGQLYFEEDTSGAPSESEAETKAQ